ncbi:MAG: hydantoinase/oxoprolinase family protein [Solirubrobacterales bacterium]|nr:hydantoinase/oxoprolinase family protein [Solirubrobacterales bacterium]
MGYFVGVDIGGTFTDCVVLGEDGSLAQSKVSTTPKDLVEGFVGAIEVAAGELGLSLEELLTQSHQVLHGTTVATNLIVQLNGSRTGLITTRGHGDALLIMRSAGRSMGLPIEKMLHVSRHKKPQPLVPPDLIQEVTERVDFAGDELVPLAENEVREAVAKLKDRGVESVAVSYLWGFVNPGHERRTAEIIKEIDPDLYVTCAHELSPRPGEYERAAATAINAYVGPDSAQYFNRLDETLQAKGYRNQVLIMQASGGVSPAADAAEKPVYTIGSGPVAGLAGTSFVSRQAGHPNVIAADMGGTSFDVGIIHEGEPMRESSQVINQYTISMPRLLIESIGSGGGSIIHVDEFSKTLRVGPESAQADPGPACYGRGGTRPTITDANVVLGMYGAEGKLSGGLRLDTEASWEAMRTVAEPMGMDPVEVAAGAKRIVDSQMAELMRQLTIERGLDPREFVPYSFGGAAGLHVSGFTAALGVERAVVPLGNLASGFSALGVADSDLLHIQSHAQLISSPFDPAELTAVFERLESEVQAQLESEGVDPEDIELSRFAEMKFSLQIHQLVIPVPGGTLSAADTADLESAFIQRYEDTYGKGSAFADAGLQIGALEVHGRGRTSSPDLRSSERTGGGAPEPVGSREVYWPELAERRESAVLAGPGLTPGDRFEGPAIVEYPSTSVAIHPGDSAEVDGLGNLLIEVGGK